MMQGAALDPPLWIVPNKSLSLSLSPSLPPFLPRYVQPASSGSKSCSDVSITSSLPWSAARGGGGSRRREQS